MTLLHVLTASPKTPAEAEHALLQLGRMQPAPDRTPLLFCDLPDTEAVRMPEDDALIRRLQVGIASLAQSIGKPPLLLVRRRAWDDAARAYLGAGQQNDPLLVVAQLMLNGKTTASFDAENFAPDTIKGQFNAVLFSPVHLSCTPDTPARMVKWLDKTRVGCVKARVIFRKDDFPPLLDRLAARGFSFRPASVRQQTNNQNICVQNAQIPMLFTLDALKTAFLDDAKLVSCVIADDCIFVSERHPSLREQMRSAHGHYIRRPVEAWTPLAQLFLLFASAFWGIPSMAYIALLVPEIFAIVQPAQWPGILVRTAFLPAHGVSALDALLRLLFARSPVFRIVLPAWLRGCTACIVAGTPLLLLAVRSTYALMPLLPLSLFWFSTPLLSQALHQPSRERIPLRPKEKDALLFEARSLYSPNEVPAQNASVYILCACGACMLGLHDPDEAARKAQTLLPNAQPRTGFEQACLLAAAQFFKEHLHACDASLRSLPAQIEALVHAAEPPKEALLLSALIRVARDQLSTPSAITLLQGLPFVDDANALFLPKRFWPPFCEENLTLPLTHPHGYLLEHADVPSDRAHVAVRFLSLCAALADHPFAALLMRSPVIAPYAPLLDQLA